MGVDATVSLGVNQNLIHHSAGSVVLNALDNPSAYGWPDATNTGPSDEGLLPGTRSGGITSTANGEVIENFWTESLTINHDNVTVRNGRVAGVGGFLVRFEPGYNTGALFEDVEIFASTDGTTPEPSLNKGLRGVQNATIRRVHIHHVQDGASNLAGCLIEDSYIHDVIKTGDAHNDCLHVSGSGVTIQHNTLLNIQSQTSCVLIQDANELIDGVLIDNNLLNGGNYTLYSEDKGSGAPINVDVTNNRWGRDHTLGTNGGGAFNIWTGNVFDDDNTEVVR